MVAREFRIYSTKSKVSLANRKHPITKIEQPWQNSQYLHQNNINFEFEKWNLFLSTSNLFASPAQLCKLQGGGALSRLLL